MLSKLLEALYFFYNERKWANRCDHQSRCNDDSNDSFIDLFLLRTRKNDCCPPTCTWCSSTSSRVSRTNWISSKPRSSFVFCLFLFLGRDHIKKESLANGTQGRLQSDGDRFERRRLVEGQVSGQDRLLPVQLRHQTGAQREAAAGHPQSADQRGRRRTAPPPRSGVSPNLT